MIDLLVVVLALFGIVGVSYGVMQRTKVTTLSAFLDQVKKHPDIVAAALKDSLSDIESTVEAKLTAGFKWLRSELVKVPAPAASDAAATVPPAVAASPADAVVPAADTTSAAAPSAGSGSSPDVVAAKKKALTEQAAQITAQLAEIQAAEGKLQSLVS